MNANVLIIDDEESIRLSSGGFLASEGHNVITANGYPEALARMDETKFKKEKRFPLPWFMRNCAVFENSFGDGDVWSVGRLLNRSFWRVGN